MRSMLHRRLLCILNLHADTEDEFEMPVSPTVKRRWQEYECLYCGRRVNGHVKRQQDAARHYWWRLGTSFIVSAVITAIFEIWMLR